MAEPSDQTRDHLSQEGETAGRAAPLDGIEQDLDTVDAALSALDADDLEGAEALATELEAPRAGPPDGREQGAAGYTAS